MTDPKNDKPAREPKLTPFDLDRWFFEHPDVIRPPELCRNQIAKIVYFASEVEQLKGAYNAVTKERDELRAKLMKIARVCRVFTDAPFMSDQIKARGKLVELIEEARAALLDKK